MNDTTGGCQKVNVPLLFWRVWRGHIPLTAKKILDMWQAKNGLRSILRWRVTNAEKPFTLSHFNENLQHFDISFDGKKTRKMVIFRNFKTSSRCHGYSKFTIEHLVTEAMGQLIYVLSFISIEAFFIVL
jgi:hypothetical protein